MRFTKEERDAMVARIDAALKTGHVDDRQKEFLTDMRSLIVEYGYSVSLSDPQYSKLEEIWENAGVWSPDG